MPHLGNYYKLYKLLIVVTDVFISLDPPPFIFCSWLKYLLILIIENIS